jgi:hypothetical protein
VCMCAKVRERERERENQTTFVFPTAHVDGKLTAELSEQGGDDALRGGDERVRLGDEQRDGALARRQTDLYEEGKKADCGGNAKALVYSLSSR